MVKHIGSSKDYLFKDSSELPTIDSTELKALGAQTLFGHIYPTMLPDVFGFALSALLDSKGIEQRAAFKLVHNGYEFLFERADIEYNEEVVVSSSFTSSIAMMIISLRSSGTDWSRKYLQHTAEFCAAKAKSTQYMKVNGAYLPAVTGYWLGNSEITSFGERGGKVTVAKLPILFDSSVTSLHNNKTNTPYSAAELALYEDHFNYTAFVSPFFFLSQENDGDGDLVKVMRGYKELPYYNGQLKIADKIVKEYTEGEYSSLKIKLKPYSVLPFDCFHSGNTQVKSSKKNVAVLSVNAYKFKYILSGNLSNTDKRSASISSNLIEAVSYGVQYLAMKAIKHNGNNAITVESLEEASNYPTIVEALLKTEVPETDKQLMLYKH